MVLNQCPDLFRPGPDLFKINRQTVWIESNRFRAQIDIDSSGQSKRHDQHGRGQEIRFHTLVDPGFKISISRKDCHHIQILFRDDPLDLRMQRAAVSDTGCTAESGQMKPEPFEIGYEPGILKVFHNHL